MSEQLGGYLPVPRAITRRKDISQSAKLLYGQILTLTSKKGYCYASNARLAEYMGLGLTSIKSCLNQLSKNNLIYIETTFANKGNATKKRKIYPLIDRNGKPINQDKILGSKPKSHLPALEDQLTQGRKTDLAYQREGRKTDLPQGRKTDLAPGRKTDHQLLEYELEEEELDKGGRIYDTDNEMHPAQLTEWKKPKSATNHPANSDQQEDGERDALPPFLKEELPKSVQQEEQKPITVTDFLSTFDTYKQGRYDAWRNDFGDRIVSAELEGMVKRINNGAKIDRPFNYLNTIFQRMGESGLVTDWESYREYKEEYYRQLGIEQYYERP